jgi:hypothetical protein
MVKVHYNELGNIQYSEGEPPWVRIPEYTKSTGEWTRRWRRIPSAFVEMDADTTMYVCVHKGAHLTPFHNIFVLEVDPRTSEKPDIIGLLESLHT